MTTKKANAKQADEAAKALEHLFALGYVSKKKLYWENFLRGIFFSVGSIIGATVGIAMLLWFLSLFSEIPLIGDFVQDVRTTVDEQKN